MRGMIFEGSEWVLLECREGIVGVGEVFFWEIDVRIGFFKEFSFCVILIRFDCLRQQHSQCTSQSIHSLHKTIQNNSNHNLGNFIILSPLNAIFWNSNVLNNPSHCKQCFGVGARIEYQIELSFQLGWSSRPIHCTLAKCTLWFPW